MEPLTKRELIDAVWIVIGVIVFSSFAAWLVMWE